MDELVTAVKRALEALREAEYAVRGEHPELKTSGAILEARVLVDGVVDVLLAVDPGRLPNGMMPWDGLNHVYTQLFALDPSGSAERLLPKVSDAIARMTRLRDGLDTLQAESRGRNRLMFPMLRPVGGTSR